MKRNTTFIGMLLLFAAAAPSTADFFEMQTDVLAQKALRDLMRIQEQYRQESGHYARNLPALGKYGLQYPRDKVFVDIESAEKDKYRAIALPSESTTARVFVYDSDKGGYYEMGDDEIPKYVLGALRHIRKAQAEKKAIDIVSAVMIAGLAAFGIRTLTRNGAPGQGTLFAAYFVSLFPLAWSMAALNHMRKDIVYSHFLMTVTVAGLACAGFGLAVCGTRFVKNELGETEHPLTALAFSGALFSLFGIGVMVYTLIQYR